MIEGNRNMPDKATTSRGIGDCCWPKDWLEANERRTCLLAIAILAALALAMFGDVLFGASSAVACHARNGGDFAGAFVPWRQFGFDELRRGNLALWNPYTFCGSPFFAGFESALLYPFNWLHLVLPLGPAINWTLTLHVFLAGAFTYLWAWHRGLHPAGRLLAGALFMFCGAYFQPIYEGHLSHPLAMTWGPLIFLSIDGIFRSRSYYSAKQCFRPSQPKLLRRSRLAAKHEFGWCLLGAFAASMQILAGHPQYVFFTALAAAIYSALCLIRAGGRWKIVACLLGVCAGGAALSAVQLLAGLDAVGETARSGGVSFSFAALNPLPPENIITLAVPAFFGNGRGVRFWSFPYWGRWYSWEVSLSIGAVGTFLAVCGAVLARRGVRRFSVTMVAVCLVLAMGKYTPLHELLHDHVPGFDLFRTMAKFIFPALLFLAMLAGLGLDALIRRRSCGKAAVGALAGAAVLGVAGLVLRASAESGSPDAWWQRIMQSMHDTREWGQIWTVYGYDLFQKARFVRDAGAFAAIGLLIACATLTALADLLILSRLSRKVLLGVMLLAMAEVFAFARTSRGTAEYTGPAMRLVEIAPELEWVVNALDGHDGDFRVLCELGSNTGMVMPWSDVWGNHNWVTRRYAEFMAFTQGNDPDVAKESLDFSSIRPLHRMLRWRFAFDLVGLDMRTVTLSDPMARLELIRQCRIVEGRDRIFEAIDAPDFDPRQTVILETPPDHWPEPFARGGRTRIVDSSTDHLTIEADLPAPAILLITDTYAKGWRAVALPGSDQDSYQLLPANYVLRAVPLKAGKHRLRVEYSPLAFRVGVWVSVVSLAAYLALLGWYVRRRKRPGDRDIVESNGDTCPTAQ